MYVCMYACMYLSIYLSIYLYISQHFFYVLFVLFVCSMMFLMLLIFYYIRDVYRSEARARGDVNIIIAAINCSVLTICYYYY